MAFDCLPLDRHVTTIVYRTYSKEISLQKNVKKITLDHTVVRSIAKTGGFR